jgi:hypothetical protein
MGFSRVHKSHLVNMKYVYPHGSRWVPLAAEWRRVYRVAAEEGGGASVVEEGRVM